MHLLGSRPVGPLFCVCSGIYSAYLYELAAAAIVKLDRVSIREVLVSNTQFAAMTFSSYVLNK